MDFTILLQKLSRTKSKNVDTLNEYWNNYCFDMIFPRPRDPGWHPKDVHEGFRNRNIKKRDNCFHPCPLGVSGLAIQCTMYMCYIVGQKWIGQMCRWLYQRSRHACGGWRGKWYNEDKYKVAGGGAGSSGSAPRPHICKWRHYVS